jgi:hypothetical protein
MFLKQQDIIKKPDNHQQYAIGGCTHKYAAR